VGRRAAELAVDAHPARLAASLISLPVGSQPQVAELTLRRPLNRNAPFNPWPWFSRSWKFNLKILFLVLQKARSLEPRVDAIKPSPCNHFQERVNDDWAFKAGGFQTSVKPGFI
jgi:hypothetical protein